MVQLIKKIKDTAGGFHSWWESDVGIIRKPNNCIPKVVEEIKQTKIMPEKIKKLLFILPADKLWARVVRRGIVVAILTFVAIILKDWLMPIAPEVWVAVIGAVLVALDKTIRELIGK